MRVLSGLVAVAVVAELITWANHWHRKHWIFYHIASMQDLPPEDRSQWHTPPVAWSNDTVEVQAATPDGPKPVHVTYFVNSIGMKLVRVAPGTFQMGLTDAMAQEVGPGDPMGGPMYTQHSVTLTHAYYIGAYEVSNQQYDLFDTAHQHRRPAYQNVADADRLPVEPVLWQETAQFCRWLSAKEGRHYRLPTEAEWEYACRAGTVTRTYWGDNFADRTKANVGGVGIKETHTQWRDDGFEYTAPCGSFPPNPWGLYDMLGNSWEWAQDWYGPFTAAPATDPRGPAQGYCRVDKGGNWSTTLHYVCSALRDGDDPGDIKDIRGFRVACDGD